MTILAARPLDDPDHIEAVADTQTPLGKVHMRDFREACWIDAMTNGGDVHPSRVSAILHDLHGDVHPQRLASHWHHAANPRTGFLDVVPGELVQIDPTYSRGNGNKTLPLRRWRDWPGDES